MVLGLQVGLQGGHQEGLQGVLYGVESFQVDSGRGYIGRDWLRVVSVEA